MEDSSMFRLNKGTPWMLQVLPSLLPFSWQERIFSGNTSFQHLNWFCFMFLRQHYVRAFHATLMLYLSCSQPTKHPASWFQLHINLLLSMEKSRSEWGTLPLAWADHFVSAISPWWSWQSYHTCTGKWNWGQWGTKTPFLASVGVLDWALKAEGSLLSPQVSLWFRVEFLFLEHRRPENFLVHTAWSWFLFFIGINTLCEQNINVCVRTSLNPANPLV